MLLSLLRSKLQENYFNFQWLLHSWNFDIDYYDHRKFSMYPMYLWYYEHIYWRNVSKIISLVSDDTLYAITHNLGTKVSNNRNANNSLLFTHLGAINTEDLSGWNLTFLNYFLSKLYCTSRILNKIVKTPMHKNTNSQSHSTVFCLCGWIIFMIFVFIHFDRYKVMIF